MNKDRRAAIKNAAKVIADAAEMITIQRVALSDIRDEEQEAFDNLSEGMKNGERGEAMQASINAIEEAIDTLDTFEFAEIATNLSDAIDRDIADMPEATLDPNEAVQRRRNRLPQWAKDEIERLQTHAREADERARAGYEDVDPERDDQFIIRDYRSPFEGKALPFNRIELRGVEITTQRGYCDGVQVRTNWSGLAVRPASGNEIIIQSLERR